MHTLRGRQRAKPRVTGEISQSEIVRLLGFGGIALTALLHGSALAQRPQVVQQFIPWTGDVSPTLMWRINGPWVGTGGNELLPSNARFFTDYPGSETGNVLALSVQPNVLQGAEIQSLPVNRFGYGYYEVRMKVTPVSGVVASFFYIQAPDYGPQEIDIEFLTNEKDFASNASHVHFTVHPSNQTFDQPLAFDPTTHFHRYGFLWTAGTVVYTVDGVAVHTFSDPSLIRTPDTQGFIMANTWTGNPNWGGGPSTQVATTFYDWIKIWPHVRSIPTEPTE